MSKSRVPVELVLPSWESEELAGMDGHADVLPLQGAAEELGSVQGTLLGGWSKRKQWGRQTDTTHSGDRLIET